MKSSKVLQANSLEITQGREFCQLPQKSFLCGPPYHSPLSKSKHIVTYIVISFFILIWFIIQAFISRYFSFILSIFLYFISFNLQSSVSSSFPSFSLQFIFVPHSGYCCVFTIKFNVFLCPPHFLQISGSRKLIRLEQRSDLFAKSISDLGVFLQEEYMVFMTFYVSSC